MRNLTQGLSELYRGIVISAQVKILQKYIPEITASDVVRYSSDTVTQHLRLSDVKMYGSFVMTFTPRTTTRSLFYIIISFVSSACEHIDI